MVLTGYNMSAQADMPEADTLQQSVQKDQSASQRKRTKNKYSGNILQNKGNENQAVKRVKVCSA